MIWLTQRSTLFPYTTLFRSEISLQGSDLYQARRGGFWKVGHGRTTDFPRLLTPERGEEGFRFGVKRLPAAEDQIGTQQGSGLIVHHGANIGVKGRDGNAGGDPYADGRYSKQQPLTTPAAVTPGHLPEPD